MADANDTDDREQESLAFFDLVNEAVGESLGLLDPIEAINIFIGMLYYVTRQVDLEQLTRAGQEEFDAMIVDLIERLKDQDYKSLADWIG